jgi:hypothetical protein
VVAAVTLTVVAVGGQLYQRRFNDRRYRGVDPVLDRILENEPHAVGLAGTWGADLSPVLPSFGPRYDHDVAYVGRFVEGTLRKYPREQDFNAALHRGGYDVLVVGHGFRPRGGPGGPPVVKEERWARSAGFEQVARSVRFTLFRAPLNASRGRRDSAAPPVRTAAASLRGGGPGAASGTERAGARRTRR